MDPGAQKPFACEVSGCGMSFSNEDHLNVHTKKHDMNLNLGSKSNVFVADQTPTPTRFIRTCDEVGLFEELLSNPFEQTFRRAVESKTKSISEDQTSPVETISVESTILEKRSNDDMLHTPHIYPNYNVINETDAQKSTDLINSGLTLKLNLKQKRPKVEGDQLITSPLENNEPNKLNVSIKEEPEDEPVIGKKVKKESPILIKPIKILPKPNNIILNLSTENIVATHPVAISINAIQYTDDIVKQKLKASILKSNPTILSNTALTTPTLIPVTAIPIAKEQLVKLNAPVTTTNHISHQKTKRNIKPDNESDKHNKNKNHANASNRAAAKRYRSRLKLKQEDLKQENTKLKDENKLLHNEIDQLKMLLSKHKDCDVTRELNSNSSVQNGTIMPVLNLQNLNNLPKIVINDSTQQPARLHIGMRKYSSITHYSVK